MTHLVDSAGLTLCYCHKMIRQEIPESSKQGKAIKFNFNVNMGHHKDIDGRVYGMINPREFNGDCFRKTINLS